MIRRVWLQHARYRADLLALVADQRATYPNSRLTVGSGWSGPKEIFDDPRSKPLADWILSGLPSGKWELAGWANVMECDDTVDLHDHRFSHRGGQNRWAGTYFIAAPEGSARLVYYYRENDMHDVVSEAGTITPEPGLLILFDAATPHRVLEHTLFEPRVSVAFNVRMV